MGIYSAKFALESAVSPEDVIQGGGEIGNDLEEIEKAIAGPDGLEANREEIENAEEGLIGDPVSEAFEAIYESEYNYNQIMHTIGINELKAASSGCELVLEAADRDGFFNKIKEWIKRAFAKVVEVFQKVLTAINAAVTKDKTFVQKHKDAILAGANSDWSAKGYIYPETIEFNKGTFEAKRWDIEAKDKLNDLKINNAEGLTLDDVEMKKSQILTNAVSGAKELSDVKPMILKQLRGDAEEPTTLNKSNISGNSIVKILSGDSEAKAIKKVYNEIKNSYKVALQEVDALQKELKKEDYVSLSAAFAVCAHYTNIIKFEKQVQTNAYEAYIHAATAKRNQARKLAVTFAAAGKSSTKKATNESAAETIFGKLNLV